MGPRHREGGSGAGLHPQVRLCPRSLVIDTLKEVGEARRCYRMVGGVLVERTVKEVLPALENNKEQVRAPRGGRAAAGSGPGAWVLAALQTRGGGSRLHAVCLFL